MLTLTLLIAFGAVVAVLYACAMQVKDATALHQLAIDVHTLRNEYLAGIRGDGPVGDDGIPIVEAIDTDADPSPAGQIDATSQTAAAA
ncbi:MAG: hypothetical protein AAFR96_00870 [Planctomycetota bacterium]